MENIAISTIVGTSSHIRLGLFLLLKTNLLKENVVNAQFSHVTRYKISVCLLHFSQ